MWLRNAFFFDVSVSGTLWSPLCVGCVPTRCDRAEAAVWGGLGSGPAWPDWGWKAAGRAEHGNCLPTLWLTVCMVVRLVKALYL